MTMSLIYVIEDHDVIRKGIGAYLENSGYSVSLFANLATAGKAISEKMPDLIIQDIMLPDGDGAKFIEEIRKTSTVPVIFMTAKVAEQDRIHGFEIGADDYITKPFSPKELVLRVQAVLRRSSMATPSEKEKKELIDSVFIFNESNRLYVNETNHELSLNGNQVVLTAAEWRVLLTLIHYRGTLLSRTEILDKCFNYSSEGYQRIVDTHIKNIRMKFGFGDWIETVRGFGYRFLGEEVKADA